MPEVYFDGKTYDPALDKEPLVRQLGRVFELMKDGEWRTLSLITAYCGGSEAGCSARLRDLRKPRFGGYKVNRRRHVSLGRFYQYQLDVNKPVKEDLFQ